MFNFQGSELIIILLLALVVLGPEKLPEAMRRMGRVYADLKKMSTGFQEEFRAAVDEPTRELRETANTLRDSLDFRKLQDGDRAEKPVSADMAPADPEAVPTDDVPFQDPAAERVDDAERRPAPFSSSQSISASPPRRSNSKETARGDVPPARPLAAVDDEHGLREARPIDDDRADDRARRNDEDGAA